MMFVLCSILPFWWRFWQCINKFYNTRYVEVEVSNNKRVSKLHMINALKYAAKLVPPIVLAVYAGSSKIEGDHFQLWFWTQMFATIYVTSWDYYMDWGLIRSFDKGNFLLRP